MFDVVCSVSACDSTLPILTLAFLRFNHCGDLYRAGTARRGSSADDLGLSWFDISWENAPVSPPGLDPFGDVDVTAATR